MTPKLTAGGRLKSAMNAALLRAREEMGQPSLEFDERERDILARAYDTADRAEALQEVFDSEQAGEGRPAVLAKVSGEIRALDRQVVDLVARVNLDVGPVKSERHQRAAQHRWSMRSV